MTIKEYEDGKWLAQVKIGGERMSKRVVGSKEEAERMEYVLYDRLSKKQRRNENENRLKNGKKRLGETTTIREYIEDRWMMYCRAHYKPSTLGSNRTCLNYIMHYLSEKTLAECCREKTADDFVERLRTGGSLRFSYSPWAREEGPTPTGKRFNDKSIGSILDKLNAILSSAYRDGDLDRPPKVRREGNHEMRPVILPSDDEVEEFLAACERCREFAPWLPEFPLLILDTGMRPTELLTMKRRAVDVATGVFHVSKVHMRKTKTRIVPMTRRAKDISHRILLAEKGNEDNLFIPNHNGLPYTPLGGGSRSGKRGFYQARLMSNQIETMSPTALRDLFTVRLLSRGVPVSVVTQLLGNKDNTATRKRYGSYIAGGVEWVVKVIEECQE